MAEFCLDFFAFYISPLFAFRQRRMHSALSKCKQRRNVEGKKIQAEFCHRRRWWPKSEQKGSRSRKGWRQNAFCVAKDFASEKSEKEKLGLLRPRVCNFP